MHQIVGIFTWRSREAGDKAHETLVPRALDRWEEISLPGAQAFVTRCSSTQTIVTALFPSAEGVVHDPQREKFRRVVQAVAKDFTDESEFVLLEGEVIASRIRE